MGDLTTRIEQLEQHQRETLDVLREHLEFAESLRTELIPLHKIEVRLDTIENQLKTAKHERTEP